jgi:hypothetical protein
MGTEIERRSSPVLWREGPWMVSLIGSLGRRSFGWRRRIPVEFWALAGGLVGGLVLGQLVMRWGEHQNLTTFMAFAPAAIELSGIPRSEINAVAERSIVRSLKGLLDKYDAYCQQFPFEALKRHIDCEHVHRIDSVPVPND